MTGHEFLTQIPIKLAYKLDLSELQIMRVSLNLFLRNCFLKAAQRRIFKTISFLVLHSNRLWHKESFFVFFFPSHIMLLHMKLTEFRHQFHTWIHKISMDCYCSLWISFDQAMKPFWCSCSAGIWKKRWMQFSGILFTLHGKPSRPNIISMAMNAP